MALNLEKIFFYCLEPLIIYSFRPGSGQMRGYGSPFRQLRRIWGGIRGLHADYVGIGCRPADFCGAIGADPNRVGNRYDGHLCPIW